MACSHTQPVIGWHITFKIIVCLLLADTVCHLFYSPTCSVATWIVTLLNFCTKCEGKFVPDSPTNNVATEHVQCTAAAGLGWWENRISSRLCQPIRGKLWFWKLCVSQWQADRGSMPLVGQLRVTFFKMCALRDWLLSTIQHRLQYIISISQFPL